MNAVIYNCLLLLCEVGICAIGWRRVCWLWLASVQPLVVAILAIVLGKGTFDAMRLASYGLFLHAPALAIVLGVRLGAVSRVWTVLGVASALLVLGIGWNAFFIEPAALEITRVALRSGKVTRPIRIAVLADLQMRTMGDYERAALRRALSQKPDLIVLPGDYVQADDGPAQHAAEDALGRYLKEIRFAAPLGVFAVRGNVDAPSWTSSFEPIQATTFRRTKSVEAGEVQITGLSVRDSFDSKLTVASSKRYHIVFGHAPDFALGTIDADLLIAGHTHGGQVRLPWFGPIITMSAVPRAWAAGVTPLGQGRTLIVSRGIGLERGYAPELRFLCRPEIVVIDVTPGAT